jgi:hypothetical protein
MPHLWGICLLGVYMEFWGPNICGKIPLSLSCALGAVSIYHCEEGDYSGLSQAQFFPLCLSISLFAWTSRSQMGSLDPPAILWIGGNPLVAGTLFSVLSPSWCRVGKQPLSLSHELDYNRKVGSTIGLTLLDQQKTFLHTG